MADRNADQVRSIVEANSPDLLAFFVRRAESQEDAADLLGDALLIIWRRADSIPSDEIKARMCMFGVARNLMTTHKRFGDMAALDVQRQPGVLGESDVRILSISAGPATRAVVRTADGREHAMLRFEGRFYGWFVGQGADTRKATLIGHAADGTEVGRTRL